MKDKKIESVLSTLCFSLFNVFFLAQHFSVWGCVYTLLTIAYYIVRINVGKKQEHYGVAEWLGTYLGAMFANFILIYGFELNAFEAMPYIGKNHTRYGVVVILIFIIGLSIIKLFDKFGQNVFKFQFWMKNILLGILACVISSIFIDWDTMALAIFVCAVIFLGICVDFIGRKNNEITRGFYAARTILVLFMVMSVFYSELAINVVNVFYNIVAFDFAPWYYYIGVLFVLLTCAIHAYLCKGDEESFDSRNLRVYCALIFAVIALLVFTTFHTTFSLLFVIVYLVVNMMFLFPIIDDRWITVFNIDISVLTLKYVLVLAMSLMLPIAFFYGWILQMFCVFTTIVGVFIMEFVVNTRVKGNRTVFKEPFFWHYILFAVTVFSCVCAYFECNNWIIYASILSAFSVSTVALIAVEHKNILQPKAHIVMKSVIVVFCAIFMMCTVNQTNVDVSATVSTTSENSAPQISIDISANEHTFTGVCSVLEIGDNLLDVATVYDVNDNNFDDVSFSQKNGVVIVSLTDDNGTGLIYYRWFFSRECYESIDVGSPKIGTVFLGDTGEVLPDQYFDEEVDVSEDLSDHLEDFSFEDNYNSSEVESNY